MAVDNWTYWSSEIKKLKKKKIIYSPQSYKEYIESIDEYIEKNTHDGIMLVGAMKMNNFKETELLQNKELKQLLKSFNK